MTLSGGSREEVRLHEFALGDVVDVRIGRRPDERIGGRPTVRIELRAGTVVALVGFGQIGALTELAERLWQLTGTRPKPDLV